MKSSNSAKYNPRLGRSTGYLPGRRGPSNLPLSPINDHCVSLSSNLFEEMTSRMSPSIAHRLPGSPFAVKPVGQKAIHGSSEG